MLAPPSTARAIPDTYEARSEHRNAATLANSSGLGYGAERDVLPQHLVVLLPGDAGGLDPALRQFLEPVRPGVTGADRVDQLTPCGPSSFDRDLEKPAMAGRNVLERMRLSIGCFTDSDAMLRILPHFACFM